MNVILLIDSREVIPVRAIPFITGGLMSPINVAASLANIDLPKKLKGITAHHLSSNGVPASMLPKEWDGITAGLQALSDKLQLSEKIKDENNLVWRRDSIPLLPAGVFVWKDEFEQAFTRFYGSDSHIRLEERPGDRELNYSPMIPSELHMTVAEGFTMPIKTGVSGKMTLTNHGYLSEKLVRMNQAAEKFWANADRNERDTHPDNGKVAAWFEQNGFSSTLAWKAATLIRPEWAPTGRKPEEQ
ncbi:hypothetical protein EBAPG3_014715 [Nitrosospira lacus]|uniref:Uncharacterized protein n=1 Tax=Nitrosospira lacus TaxID=1288494 RepID=A0A1W6SSX9_9PROT|nr:hypothetical protein [Nitrosospira lacus]ARO88918.1 hypothetical protein EBAPG3_014715 [Nitrosospira lacus]